MYICDAVVVMAPLPDLLRGCICRAIPSVESRELELPLVLVLGTLSAPVLAFAAACCAVLPPPLILLLACASDGLLFFFFGFRLEFAGFSVATDWVLRTVMGADSGGGGDFAVFLRCIRCIGVIFLVEDA